MKRHPEGSEGCLGTGVPRENMVELPLRAYFFVAPREGREGSLGACAPREDKVEGDAVPSEARRDAVPNEVRDALLSLGTTVETRNSPL
jgi:hypothetical protein